MPDGHWRREKLSGEDGGVLAAWFAANRRDLPWRRTKEPYAIWVSEVMCQQTQVATVVPYFERWMARYPDVATLAASDEEEALAVWQGLGYYRRCRLLLEGARWMAANGVPQGRDGWMQVPGVGRYTASAVASIAFGAPVAAVDGNVERVFARLTGSSAQKSALRAKAWAWADYHLYADDPGNWNQALMELGATVCTPRKPRCGDCPLREECVARSAWQVEKLPVPRPQTKVVQVRHVVWVPLHEGAFGVRKIPPGQWWEGMWEFPRVDAAEDGEAPRALSELVGPGWAEDLGVVRHVVTNHRITIDASLVRAEARSRHLRWATAKELEALPMPTSQRKILRLALELL